MLIFLLLHMVGAYTCGPGTFDRHGECQNCSAGKYQPMAATSACLQCPHGQYQLATGSVDCLDCPTSAPCCEGYGIINDTCIECQVGHFSGQIFGFESVCVPCDSHQIAVRLHHGIYTFGKTGSNACYDCPQGTRPVENVCKPCSPGTSLINHECISCPAGWSQSESGTTACVECSAGFYSDTERSEYCTPCPQNTNTSRLGSVACAECSVGRKSPTASLECFDTCPEKTIDIGSTCEHCSPGKYFSVDACVDCPDGFVKSHDYELTCTRCTQSLPNSDKTSCVACPQGKYFDEETCRDCGQGTFGSWIVENVSLLSCRNCPSGFAQHQTAQVECQMCLPGRYSYTEVECVDCPIGFVAPLPGSSRCQECPVGTGANQSQECVPCQGSFGSVDGMCSLCPIGKFASNGECLTCPHGRISNMQGSIECVECPTGFYSYNTSECRTCNASNQEYTNFAGNGSSHCIECSDPTVACQTCAPGRYHVNGVCEACPQGRVNNGNRVCSLCPEFTVPNEQQSDCISCLPGYQADDDQCVACSAGQYSTNNRCLACPLGQYQSNQGALSCIECPNGTTTASEKSAYDYNCQTCFELGEITSTVILNHVCSTCLAGYVPSSTLDSCEVCPQGRHRFDLESECHECPIGKFSNNHEPCQDCPTGFYNTQVGQAHCQECLVNINNGETNICNECAAGYKKIEEEGITRCEACLPGTFSLVGQTECQLCSAGQYQDQSSSSSCQLCPTGQFQDLLGQTSCTLCPKGHFQPLLGQGACHACPVSHYASSLGSSECTPCPPGSVTASEGSVNASQCIECPQGFKESFGMCQKCPEGQYQNISGQISCHSCLPGQTSLLGSTSSDDCFSLKGMVSYVFGMKGDSKPTQSYTKTCEIRPNGIILCPGCTCDSDSRNGFWDSPICDECQRGFATRTCKVGCAGYDGVHDSTMCNGNGRCWFGKFGNGLCYCGGQSQIDAGSENIVVDVQYCPKGQICPNYGLTEQVETVYRPIYYIILYRQYSAFVLQLNEYTPARGHMWFQRFPRNAAYENRCSACTGAYQENIQTSTGYYAKDGMYHMFKDALQTKNGFHGENCQHECGVCLSGGRCDNKPHDRRYAYSIVGTFQPQKNVYIAKTSCICPSISMDSEQMCCPNGFQPYVYYGVRDSMPYTRFTQLPLITSIVNERRDFWIRRDILLEPQYPLYYSEPLNGLQWVGGDRGTFTQKPFVDVGVYDTHPFYGIPQDICRACPGLFGKGVRSASHVIEDEAAAKEFWWDNAIGAKSRKCNGVGVCNFYAKDLERDVHFMGDAASYLEVTQHYACNGPSNKHSTFQNDEGYSVNIRTIQDCASAARDAGASWFAFSETYKGGSMSDMNSNFSWATKLEAQQYAFNTNAIGYASFMNHSQLTWMVLDMYLPIPDSSSDFEIFRTEGTVCESYNTCDSTDVAPGMHVYTFVHGRGADRLPSASFDRFDTCFTYSLHDAVSLPDSTYTIDYVQGDDPFLGGLCPKGYFCSMHQGIGYKEACPAGYYQPDIGRTRTVTSIDCSKTIQQSEGCAPLTTTNVPHDYVDKVCRRCPRQMWSAPGSYACNECPIGRVKKISGIFDTSTRMINMPTATSAFNIWYYQTQETGIMNEDCALVPSGVVHVVGADQYMNYDSPHFLPVITCPYGYSTQPGTSIGNQFADFATILGSKLNVGESLIDEPFLQIETIYKTSPYGNTCEEAGLKPIQTLKDCRTAASFIGIEDVRQRPGLFKGCWSSSIRPNVVYWSSTGKNLCIPSLRYMCQDEESMTTQWSNFVRNKCFRCPGTSVSGPESGSCTNCFGNHIKEYAKHAIQKISENAIVPMKKENGNEVNLILEYFKNALLSKADGTPGLVTLTLPSGSYQMNKEQARERCIEAGYRLCVKSEVGRQDLCNYGWMEDTDLPGYWRQTTAPGCGTSGWNYKTWGDPLGNAHCCLERKSILLEPKTNVDLTLSDCYIGCQSVSQTLKVLGLKKDSSKCSCGVDDATDAQWDWYAVSYEQWSDAQPLCSNCEPGQYSDGDCKDCPAGYYTSSIAESNTGQCQTCAPGSFQPQPGQKECQQCPSGFFQALEGAEICEACAEGKYQTQLGMQRCLTCPQGFRQPSTGQFECITCPVGKYDNLLASECIACSPGKYQDVSSALNCKVCAAGMFSSVEGRTTPCDSCVAGTYQPQTGQATCMSCAIGTFSSEEGSTEVCTACPSGWYAMNNGQAECTPCPGGFKCSQTSLGDFCPRQTYLPERTWANECEICQAEQQVDEPARSECDACPEGKTTKGLSGVECNLCPDAGWRGMEGWNGMEFQTQNVSELSRGLHYVSVSSGFCTQHSEPFANVLATEHPLYDTNRVQECMLRCSNVSSSYFFVRLSDHQCTCASECDEQTANSEYQTFRIAESPRYVQTFDTYVVALSTGVREFTFFDVDDFTTLETWQQTASTGHYEMTPFATTTIYQTWTEGAIGRIKITCGNTAGLYNCHFKMTKDGSFPDFAFYEYDPGSAYCALQI